jgi:HlyD family secretion protein
MINPETPQNSSTSNQMFRKKALEKLSSPDQLDQMTRVLKPRAWISLLTLSGLVSGAIAWSIWGRIPVTVSAQGILVRPDSIRTLQSSASGRITQVEVEEGDLIQKGEVIARVNQYQLSLELDHERDKLKELEQDQIDETTLERQKTDADRLAQTQQRVAFQNDLEKAPGKISTLKEQTLTALRKQRDGLSQNLAESEALLPILKDRVEKRKQLRQQKIIADDLLLQSQQEYLTMGSQVSSLESQLKQLDVQSLNAEQQYLKEQNELVKVGAQVKGLDAQDLQLKLENRKNWLTRNTQILNTKRHIIQLEKKLREQSLIVSPFKAMVLDLAIAPSQVISPGSRVGSLERIDSKEEAIAAAFLPIDMGKKISKGMSVQVTPTTVEKSRYGGVVGKVTQVSPFPITVDDIDRMIGNPETAKLLVGQGSVIQVSVALEKDSKTPSGYRWSSSKGPKKEITTGTTIQASIKVEERAPISYVIPLLKSLTGID